MMSGRSRGLNSTSQSGYETRLALFKLMNIVVCNFMALEVRTGIE